jgi:hypothetical protein
MLKKNKIKKLEKYLKAAVKTRMNVKSLYNGPPPLIIKINIKTQINEEMFETIDRIAKLNDIIEMILFDFDIEEFALSIFITDVLVNFESELGSGLLEVTLLKSE